MPVSTRDVCRSTLRSGVARDCGRTRANVLPVWMYVSIGWWVGWAPWVPERAR